MDNQYDIQSRIFKALSDSSRLKIIDMLSCGERCACELLDMFEFTQPTLSHHMKILMASRLVKCRKEGLWSFYSLDSEQTQAVLSYLRELVTETENCICRQMPENPDCR